MRKNKEVELRDNFSTGFVAGLWFAIEQLVDGYDLPGIALNILEESGIKKWEFERNLKRTGYLVRKLKPLLKELED